MLRNGPFWTREWAVLNVGWSRFGLVFLPLGPFWRWAVLVGSPFIHFSFTVKINAVCLSAENLAKFLIRLCTTGIY